MATKRAKIADLTPDVKNANRGTQRGNALLETSLQRLGAGRSILLDKHGRIIAGNKTAEKAGEIGLEDVLIVQTDGTRLVAVQRTDLDLETDERARQLAFADNRVTEVDLDFDPAALAASIDEGVDLSDFWREEEIEALLAAVQPAAPVNTEDDALPDNVPTRVQPGEIWQCGKHRVMCGDSKDAGAVALLMNGMTVPLIVTSPPYNQGIDQFHPSGMHKEGDWVSKVERLAYDDSKPEEEYQTEQRAFLSAWHNLLNDNGSVFYNHKNRYREKQVVSPLAWLPGPFKLRQEIIWRRPGSVTQNARMFPPCDERIYWLYKGDDFYFDDSTEIKTWSSVWDISPETNKKHAVAFPLELPMRPIRACSHAGDIIFDPFLGSGTTLIAAERTGRVCYGMEISAHYCDVILARWEAETGREAVRVEEGAPCGT